MATTADLPHLVRLLDDDSEIVRESVLSALASFGPYLEIELSRSNIATTDEDRHRLRNLLGQHARQWLQRSWHLWKESVEDQTRLEQAMSLLAEFQYGPGYPASLTALLNKLEEDYRRRTADLDPLSLASYLFKTRGLVGAEKDYHNPFHSNLVYVIEVGRGIPLSLATIFILVGGRLQMDIRGINFPGHFLARACHHGTVYVVDCFNGGRFLQEHDLAAYNRGAASQIAGLIDASCPAETIIARCLRNLNHSYRQEDQPENAALMAELLQTVAPDADDTQ